MLTEIVDIIRKEADKMGIKVEKIILFGSRARGDYREDSDYDILVVTREKLPRRTLVIFKRRVRLAIYKVIRRPVDVVVASREQWEKLSALVGTVLYEASREGITLWTT